MVGLIISGHGNFASGLSSSLKLIAGVVSNVEFVDFEENDTPDTLKEKYYTSLKKLNNCQNILALTDLAGGSPFKTLVEISSENLINMEVVGGTNLPMLLELAMTKDFFDDFTLLCESALDIGKSGIVKFALIEHKEIECEEGI